MSRKESRRPAKDSRSQQGTNLRGLVRLRLATAQYRDNTRYKIPGRIVYVGLDYKLGAATP